MVYEENKKDDVSVEHLMRSNPELPDWRNSGWSPVLEKFD